MRYTKHGHCISFWDYHSHGVRLSFSDNLRMIIWWFQIIFAQNHYQIMRLRLSSAYFELFLEWVVLGLCPPFMQISCSFWTVSKPSRDPNGRTKSCKKIFLFFFISISPLGISSLCGWSGITMIMVDIQELTLFHFINGKLFTTQHKY